MLLARTSIQDSAVALGSHLLNAEAHSPGRVGVPVEHVRYWRLNLTDLPRGNVGLINGLVPDHVAAEAALLAENDARAADPCNPQKIVCINSGFLPVAGDDLHC